MVILSEHRESKELSFLRAPCALPISVSSVLGPSLPPARGDVLFTIFHLQFSDLHLPLTVGPKLVFVWIANLALFPQDRAMVVLVTTADEHRVEFQVMGAFGLDPHPSVQKGIPA